MERGVFVPLFTFWFWDVSFYAWLLGAFAMIGQPAITRLSVML
jgi:hypothetical protein